MSARAPSELSADILPTKLLAPNDIGNDEQTGSRTAKGYNKGLKGIGWHGTAAGLTDFKSVGPGPSVGAVGSTPSRSRHRYIGVNKPSGVYSEGFLFRLPGRKLRSHG